MKILPPYFSATLPTIIDTPGKYKTRCGEIVIIEKIDTRIGITYTCHGQYGEGKNGIVDCWHKSGLFFPSRETNNDIVEKIK